MFCPNCGFDCGNENFCSKCGRNLRRKFSSPAQLEQYLKSNNMLYCPKCLSTRIEMNTYSWRPYHTHVRTNFALVLYILYGLIGMVGSRMKKCVCQKCGHEWYIKRKR